MQLADCDNQLSQHRGHDSHRSLDAGLHLLCVRCPGGLRLPVVEEEKVLPQAEENQETDRRGIGQEDQAKGETEPPCDVRKKRDMFKSHEGG